MTEALTKVVRGKGGDKWSDSGYISKMEPTGFSDGLTAGLNKREVKQEQ